MGNLLQIVQLFRLQKEIIFALEDNLENIFHVFEDGTVCATSFIYLQHHGRKLTPYFTIFKESRLRSISSNSEFFETVFFNPGPQSTLP